MNNRIQELIEQATIYEKGPPNWSMTENVIIKVFNKEVFAELLIKECANQINSLRERGGTEVVDHALFLAECKLNDFAAESFPRKAISAN